MPRPAPAPRPRGRLSLEELLQVKRCERPDEAFWVAFNRRLHHRAFQSMVEEEPFWIRWANALRRGSVLGTVAAALVVAVMAGRSGLLSPPPTPGGVSAAVSATPEAVADKPADAALALIGEIASSEHFLVDAIVFRGADGAAPVEISEPGQVLGARPEGGAVFVEHSLTFRPGAGGEGGGSAYEFF